MRPPLRSRLAAQCNPARRLRAPGGLQSADQGPNPPAKMPAMQDTIRLQPATIVVLIPFVLVSAPLRLPFTCALWIGLAITLRFNC